MVTEVDRLVLRLEATTAQFERQMARAAGLTKNQARDMSRSFDSINASQNRWVKSAEASANVFTREFAKIDRQVESLRRSLDPTFDATQRFERAQETLNRALEAGSIDLRTYESTLELARAELNLSANAAQRFAAAGGTVSRGFGGSRGQIQNVAFQVGDFATQVGAGTAASVALGQQLPQLLGGFGALGAVLGAVVAIGVPLGAALLRAGDNAEETIDAMDGLSAAVNDYVSATNNALIPTDELVAKYGTATEAAREFSRALRDISEFRVEEAGANAAQDLLTSFSEGNTSFGDDVRRAASDIQVYVDTLSTLQRQLQDGEGDPLRINQQIAAVDAVIRGLREENSILNELQREFDLTLSQAGELAGALQDLSQAEGSADRAAAANELRVVLERTFGTIEQMPPAIRAAFEQTLDLGEAAAEVQGAFERGNVSILDMSSFISTAATNIGIAASQADGLAGALAAAAQNAFEAARGLAVARRERALRGPDQAVQEVRDQLTPTGLNRADIVLQRTFNSGAGRSSSGAGSSGGGGGGGSAQPEFTIDDLLGDDLSKLERQFELFGEGAAEVARLTAEYKFLSDAKERGLDLDRVVNANGQTLLERIEQEAEAIGNMTRQLEDAQTQRDAINSGLSDLSNNLVDAAGSWETLGDAAVDSLKRILVEYAKASVLQGLGRITGTGTGTEIAGSFLGALIPGFATGTRNAPGGLAVVGERGPELVNLPKGSEVIPNFASRDAMQGGAEVILRTEPGVVAEIVHNEAGLMIQQNNAAQNKALPTRVKQITSDRRRA